MIARVSVVVLLALALTACTRHFWTKPGATLHDFGADSITCTQRVGQRMPDRPGYGIVPTDVYRTCLRALGWQREELGTSKAPPGYFRGIEDEDIVRLDAVPPQPAVDVHFGQPRCARGTAC